MKGDLHDLERGIIMRIFIYGIVQGVGFRPTVFTIARRMGLRGFVRNNGSNVEVCVDTDGEEFISFLRQELPPLASIERIDRTDPDRDHTDYTQYPEFIIVPSTAGNRSSSIPVDTALCDPCVGELLGQENRRHHYPFTNCTDCGARYSVIGDLPYDRALTTMDPFPLCPFCTTEYGDPGNRRLHAQTISCPECGPHYTLYSGLGTPARPQDPFPVFARMIEVGGIGVLKSWGGMHILASFDSIPQLRERYGRKTKPFALMLRDLKTVTRYTHVNQEEEELLTSSARPIVLLRKREGFPFLDDAAPGLDYVGVMLPYTAAHHILFEHLTIEGIVATSANLPGEAMITSNDEAFTLNMDSYLLHNREIAQRVDDSLVKVHRSASADPDGSNSISTTPLFIRKSRGYVPTHLDLPFTTPIMAVGPERNVTGAVVANSRLFQTQYIGNTRNYSNLMFLESALNHLHTLTGASPPEFIVRDLHPGYATNRIARSFSEKFECPIVTVQHHHAHAASLLLDRGTDLGMDGMVVLTLDGTGYGPDGTVWGGEVLWTNGPEYQRVGTLEHMPMPGGDLAVRDPRRMACALGEMTGHPQNLFEPMEERIVRNAIGSAPLTTSMGRVLDSLSYILDGWCERNYDGEPAMRLEPLLERGRFYPELLEAVSIRKGEGKGGGEGERNHERDGVSIVDQLGLYSELFERIELFGSPHGSGQRAADLAHTFVRRIMDGFVTIACNNAESRGLKHIGLTGGVAYSLPLIRMFEEGIRERGMVPVLHKRLPPGDGGISAGQVYVIGMGQR